ncbi:MAG: pantoate--beta-alanine ligase [Actinomycetota bacterium]|nr:pantoate--beta-alanine ligase [Actinomycetota bacterium]
MRTVTTARELRAEMSAHRMRGAGVGLVPTMGALHAGHQALLARARDRHEVVVASVFVNPMQFERADDLARYPRDPSRDRSVLEEASVDVCFSPSVDEMYPDGEPVVRVDPGPLGSVLEGASRPGHFAGVATVVAKLLALVAPDAVYLGEKDFQQLVVVRRLVRDLSFPVGVVGCATVREPDGLALSSRNSRLSPAGRSAATALHRALLAGAEAWRGGSDPARCEQVVAREVSSEPLASLDYAVAVDDRLASVSSTPPPPVGHAPARLLVAAVVEGIRLIDNLEVGR